MGLQGWQLALYLFGFSVQYTVYERKYAMHTGTFELQSLSGGKRREEKDNCELSQFLHTKAFLLQLNTEGEAVHRPTTDYSISSRVFPMSGMFLSLSLN